MTASSHFLLNFSIQQSTLRISNFLLPPFSTSIIRIVANNPTREHYTAREYILINVHSHLWIHLWAKSATQIVTFSDMAVHFNTVTSTSILFSTSDLLFSVTLTFTPVCVTLTCTEYERMVLRRNVRYWKVFKLKYEICIELYCCSTEFDNLRGNFSSQMS